MKQENVDHIIAHLTERRDIYRAHQAKMTTEGKKPFASYAEGHADALEYVLVMVTRLEEVEAEERPR